MRGDERDELGRGRSRTRARCAPTRSRSAAGDRESQRAGTSLQLVHRAAEAVRLRASVGLSHPRVEIRQRAFRQRQRCAPLSCAAPCVRPPAERRDDPERDVRRLIVARFRVRHVVRERTDGRRARRAPRAARRARALPRCGPRSAPTRRTQRILRRPKSARRRTDRPALFVCHVSRSTVGPLM